MPRAAANSGLRELSSSGRPTTARIARTIAASTATSGIVAPLTAKIEPKRIVTAAPVVLW